MRFKTLERLADTLMFATMAFGALLLLSVGASLAETTVVPGPATTTVVAVPVGDWVTQIAPVIQDALLALVTALVAFALRSLPAAIRTYVTAGITAQVEQICDRGIEWAIAAVAGASKDKVWTVPVGNAVVAQAVQYIVSHGPAWLVTWMGGKDLIAQKIIGRIGDLLPDNAQVLNASRTDNTITASPVVASNAGATAGVSLPGVLSGPLAG